MDEPDELRSARLHELYARWDRMRRGFAAMPRSALDPTRFPVLVLPYLAVIDVLADAADFRYRLVGTGVVDMVGRDFTGELVSAFGKRHEHEHFAAGYREVVTTHRPHRYVGDLRNEGRELVTYERLALPVTGDAETVDQILVGFTFSEPSQPDA